jgi:8-oxo-dGTP pyrophosphatase MutT (NUDIX family)
VSAGPLREDRAGPLREDSGRSLRDSGSRRGGSQVVPRPEGWRLGGAAPWPPAPDGGRFALEAVVEAVRRQPPNANEVPLFQGARASAVLVALHDGPVGAEVVLTRRSQSLRNHRGEISFPGGRLDAGETPEHAALREADEEVALAPEAVELVGRLPPLATVVSLSHIVPVVGRLRARPALRPAAAEVERILHVPLRDLAEPAFFREEWWGEAELARSIFFFDLEDETIWGATARILVDLLSVALGD